MIDFSALVLGPAMATFGQPITVSPVASRPGQPAYSTKPDGTPLTGVYASKPVQIPLEDGTYHSTVQPTLGIRLADFAVAPMQDDTVVVGALGTFAIADITPDGQGGADLVLRNPNAVTSTTIEDGA